MVNRSKPKDIPENRIEEQELENIHYNYVNGFHG